MVLVDIIIQHKAELKVIIKDSNTDFTIYVKETMVNIGDAVNETQL